MFGFVPPRPPSPPVVDDPDGLLSTQALRARFFPLAAQGLITVEQADALLTELFHELHAPLLPKQAGISLCRRTGHFSAGSSPVVTFTQFKETALALSGRYARFHSYSFYPHEDVEDPARPELPPPDDGVVLEPPPPPPPAAPAVLSVIASKPRVPLLAHLGAVPPVVVVAGVRASKTCVWLVMRFLDAPDILNAAQVCRVFALVARDDVLWDPLVPSPVYRAKLRLRKRNRASLVLAPTGNRRLDYLKQRAYSKR